MEVGITIRNVVASSQRTRAAQKQLCSEMGSTRFKWMPKETSRVGRRRYVQKFQGVRHEDELDIIMRAAMIRRAKDEMLTQFSEKQRQRVVMIASDDKALQAILPAPGHSHGHGYGPWSYLWS